MTRVFRVLLPLVGLLLLSPSSGAGEPPSFAGTVRSSVGAVLEGVEVLVASNPATTRPVAAATTDQHGKFRIAELAPGVYRIAALKHGYTSFVGQVDTRLERWIELILRPESGLSDERRESLPEDPSWALRLPRRHVLRESENTLLDRTGPVHGEDALSMRVDQLFAVGPSLDARRPDDPSMRGTETRLRLASLIGERGRIRVSGHRESLQADRTGGSRGTASAASDDAAGLSFAFAYETGVDGQVTVDAFYRERDLRWNPLLSDPASSVKQAHRAWGGRSGWTKQLDPVSRLAISLDFQDAALRLPRDATAAAPVVNRSVAASGSYGTLRSDDHQVQVDFKARLLDTSLPHQRLASVGRQSAFGGVEGFTVGVQARDTWRVTGPFSLIYGLGYSHSVRLADSSLIVPQLGGSWLLDNVSLSVLMSYHEVAEWSDRTRPGPSSGPYRPAGAFGYRTRLELPLTETLRMTGSTSYTPIEMELADIDPGAWGAEPSPIYLTDGNAAVYRNRLALIRVSGGLQTYAEVAQGRAEGMLAAVLPYEIPYQDLSQRNLSYLASRVGLRIVPAGTHFVIEYRQVDEWQASESGPESATNQRSLELRLIQDLMRRRDIGNWRLLMGVRVASLEADTEDWLAAGNQTIVENLGGRLRAGLSVEF